LSGPSAIARPETHIWTSPSSRNSIMSARTGSRIGQGSFPAAARWSCQPGPPAASRERGRPQRPALPTP
jgi:hypothetical protein